MDVKQTYTKARDLIQAGWRQGSYSYHAESGSCYCAAGAIREAAGIGVAEKASDLFAPLAATIGGSTDEHEGGVINWNDDRDRTRDEVIAAFDKAIAQL